jgi:hypothetical protein
MAKGRQGLCKVHIGDGGHFASCSADLHGWLPKAQFVRKKAWDLDGTAPAKA